MLLWATYEHDIAAIAERLPPNAREFALAKWHRDPQDHRCIHDSWIEELKVKEIASGDRQDHRMLEVSVRLLGAYHDRYLVLSYSAVRLYSLTRSTLGSTFVRHTVAHGDLLDDSFAMTEDGYIIHKIRLEFGLFEIEAKDIKFSEELI